MVDPFPPLNDGQCTLISHHETSLILFVTNVFYLYDFLAFAIMFWVLGSCPVWVLAELSQQSLHLTLGSNYLRHRLFHAFHFRMTFPTFLYFSRTILYKLYHYSALFNGCLLIALSSQRLFTTSFEHPMRDSFKQGRILPLTKMIRGDFHTVLCYSS
jgi:hypothetical protein